MMGMSGRAPAHALGHLMGEFGAVEDHESIGTLRDHGVHRLPNAPPDVGQARQHVNEAHDGKLRQRKERRAALLGHQLAADTLKLERSCRLGAQALDELGAKRVARVLAGDQKQLQRP